jgi:hypothetical protein
MTPGLSTCTRCGKVRIVTKTYKEYIGDSLVVTNLTSCPDADCQAIVDKQLAKEQKFRDEMQIAGEKRLQEAKERRAQKTP